MNGYDEEREETGIVQYRGIPHEPNSPGEKGRWRQFLEWSMPWLKQKWDLGEAVVAAKAAQEVAKARHMMADARRAELETLALAREMEAEKLAVLPSVPADPAELEDEMRALLAKLEALGWKHGTRINFAVVEEGGEATAPPPSAASAEPATSDLAVGGGHRQEGPGLGGGGG